jgi:hypothetical protein
VHFARVWAGARVPFSKDAPCLAETTFNLAPIRAASGHETVLVVEDDPDVLDIAVSGLLDLGYDVKTATDAHEALAILRVNGGIDVLFSDVVMPMRPRPLARSMGYRRPSRCCASRIDARTWRKSCGW